MARVVGTGLALLVVGFAWWKVAITFRDVRSALPATQPTAIVWGARVYSDPASFRGWLRARGLRYGAWAKNHPQALAILERRPYRAAARPAAAKRTAVAAAKRTPVAARRPAAPTAPTRAAVVPRGSRDMLAVVVAALATLLLGAAALPRALVICLPSGAVATVLSARPYLATVGASILLGVAAALLL